MSELNFKNCSFNSDLIINTSSVVKTLNQNSPFTLTYGGTNDIINKKLIMFDNNYTEDIIITSSAVIRLLDNFSCNKLIINSNKSETIYIIGDLSRIENLIINCPCSIYSNLTEPALYYSNTQPKITIDINNSLSDNQVKFNGSFKSSTIDILSSTNLILAGNFNTINIAKLIKATICFNTSVNIISSNEDIQVTAPKSFFEKLNEPGGTIKLGSGEILPDIVLYKVKFIDNMGTVISNIKTPGIYSMSYYLMLDNKSYLIENHNINVN